MTGLLLVRHAHCAHVGRCLAGRAPGVSLSGEGRAQATALARALADQPVTAVYSSPLERALETAAAIAAARSLPVLPHAELTDIDYGDWTGARFADLEEDPRWQLYNRHRSRAAVPGGEAPSQVQERALDAVLSLARLHPGETIVAVSHADVIRSILAHARGIPLDDLLAIDVEPASVHTLFVEGGVIVDTTQAKHAHGAVHALQTTAAGGRRLATDNRRL